MTEEEQRLSAEELAILEEAMKDNRAMPEEKNNIHTFLKAVANSKDTTKTGNLEALEIGITPYSLRTYKSLQLDCEMLVDDDIWKEYYQKHAEILTSTSLSKNAKLINLAVVQRKELADITPARAVMTENKGWFSKKDKSTTVEQ